MPQNGLSLGRDYKFDIYTATGLLVLPTLLNFKRRKINHKLTVKPLNGLPIHLNFQEGGWEGSFDVSRADGTLDTHFANNEAFYYAGANLPTGVIQETIEEVAGVPTTFQFQGVILYYEDPGEAEAEKNVIQRVSFAASTRIKL